MLAGILDFLANGRTDWTSWNVLTGQQVSLETRESALSENYILSVIFPIFTLHLTSHIEKF